MNFKDLKIPLMNFFVQVFKEKVYLVGGTIRAQLRRADLERILLNGFLPAVPSSEMPETFGTRSKRSPSGFKMSCAYSTSSSMLKAKRRSP